MPRRSRSDATAASAARPASIAARFASKLLPVVGSAAARRFGRHLVGFRCRAGQARVRAARLVLGAVLDAVRAGQFWRAQASDRLEQLGALKAGGALAIARVRVG